MPQQYQVQKIMDKQVRNGKNYYKVKWEGYPEDQCTWQPEKNLNTVKDIVEKFNQKIARIQKNNKYQINTKNRVNLAVRSTSNNKINSERETLKKSTKKKPTEEESQQSDRVEQDQEQSAQSQTNYKRPMPSNLKKAPPPRKTAPYSRISINTSQKMFQSDDFQPVPRSPISNQIPRLRNETENGRLEVLSMMMTNDNECYFQVIQNGKSSTLKRKQLIQRDPITLVLFYESHIRYLPNKF